MRSTPPGAVVHVDNQRIGTTPCSVDYVYYGTREIRLTLPGYETLTVNQPLPAPWYELPGIDFVSETLVPATINDARTVSFNLQRERLAPASEVIARAEQLRRQATPVGAAPIVPASATAPFEPPSGNVFTPSGPASSGPLPPAAAPRADFMPSPQVLPPVVAPTPADVFQPTPAPPAPGLPDSFRY